MLTCTSCYEAGASGYWLHRQLEQMGAKNLVGMPKAMGQAGKKQKTDKRDSAELCGFLDRYPRGQDKALSVVGVPTVEQEENQSADPPSSPDYGRPGSL